jgi:hypothetical protein
MVKNKLTWAQVVRQNTGSHFLDSGFENGRHWQQPLPTKAIELDFYERDGIIKEVSGTISTSALLDATTEIDQDLTEWLREASKDTSDMREYAKLLAEELGLVGISKPQYTYDNENDLSQNFQYVIVGANSDSWLGGLEESYVIVTTHNGADARGGFSCPVVCKVTDGDFNFFDLGLSIQLKGVGEFAYHDLECHNERLEIGYSSCPSEELRKMVKAYKSVDVANGEFIAELVTGETVMGWFYHNAI